MDKEKLEEWFDTWKSGIGYERRDLRITTSGDVAFCHALAHLTGAKTDGQNANLWLRLTLGLRKIAGQWKIVHQHESVPFEMDGSFKAAVDLKPQD